MLEVGHLHKHAEEEAAVVGVVERLAHRVARHDLAHRVARAGAAARAVRHLDYYVAIRWYSSQSKRVPPVCVRKCDTSRITLDYA